MQDICVREGEKQISLVLCGAIEAPRLGELLANAILACGARKPVTLEWSEAEHLHAGALQVLLALNNELAVQGRPLRVSACSNAVRECLGAAGLLHAFQDEPGPKEV